MVSLARPRFTGLTVRSFIPELFSQQHLKLINAQITPKRPASSFMLTESLIFFLLKFVFKKFGVSPEFRDFYLIERQNFKNQGPVPLPTPCRPKRCNGVQVACTYHMR